MVSRSQVLRGGCGWRPFERAIGVLSLAVTPCLHPCATGTGSGLGTTDPAAMHPSACTAGTRLRVASHGLLAGGVRSCWGCVWPVNAAQCCHRRTGSRPSAATRAGRAGPVSPPARRLRSTNPESGSGSPLACLSRVPPVPKSWGGGEGRPGGRAPIPKLAHAGSLLTRIVSTVIESYLSKSLAAAMDVTLEDQQSINRFSRLNTSIHEISAKLKAIKARCWRVVGLVRQPGCRALWHQPNAAHRRP